MPGIFLPGRMKTPSVLFVMTAAEILEIAVKAHL
jgi:hypothetical protein